MTHRTSALLAAVLAVVLAQPALAADKIALVVKSLGNGFFDAAHQGAMDAAKELKDAMDGHVLAQAELLARYRRGG